MSNIPRYALVGDRPVKAEADETGNVFVYAWDWDRKIFVKDSSYFEKIFLATGPETTMLTEEAFQEAVDDLPFAS